MNRQVKSAIGAVKEFLAGRSGEAKVADSDDQALRRVVGAELLAAMSGSLPEEMAEEMTRNDQSHDDALDSKHANHDRHRDPSGKFIKASAAFDAEATAQIESQSIPDAERSASHEHNAQLAQQQQERARQLFLDHGYFDETVEALRAGNSAAERAAAARALGMVGNQRATAHLIAAMFDDDPEVRSAAEEALSKIGDSTVASDHASAVIQTETDIEKPKAGEILPPVQNLTVPELPVAKSVTRESVGNVEHATGHGTASKRAANRRRVVSPIPPSSASTKAHERASAKQTTNLIETTETIHPTGDSHAPRASLKASLPQPAQQTTEPGIFDDETAARDVEQMVNEEQAVREALAQLERRLIEATEVRQKSEKEVRWRIERESNLRAEAASRRGKEEELRKQAAEELEQRRLQDIESAAVEEAARVSAEAEAQRFAQEEARLRLEAATLRLTANELVVHKEGLETVRKEAAEAARRAEAKRARDEAESRHKAELERLRSEEEGLRIAAEELSFRRSEIETARAEALTDVERLKKEQEQLSAAEAARRAETERLREAEEQSRAATEQLSLQLEALSESAKEAAARRAEVESAREKADQDAQRLVETHARMRAAEEVRAQAESERLHVEAEIHLKVETEQRLLEEARQRAQQEQKRLEEATRQRAEEEQQRLAELEVARAKAEIESKQRAEQEQRLLSQLDSLRIGDAETRRRIEDAEVRRRSAEEAYRLAAERVQRVETEAHVREKEEEQILKKLEAERRTVAVNAQVRADQEKRIREELEMFRRLEEEERPRLEAAIIQRTEAQARLQQLKDRFRVEEETRVRAEELFNVVLQYQETPAEEAGERDWRESEIKPGRPEPSLTTYEASAAISADIKAVAEEQPAMSDQGQILDVTPAIITYLNSVDPYKRAAAVAELARSHTKESFGLIANCFDDHSPHVRNAAARALRKLEPHRTVDLFNRALEEGTAERRRNIGAAIAASGLATEAIDNLASESREDTYNALSILFVMAKNGEVQPLVNAIEHHENDEVSRAVIKLLTLSGQTDIADEALKRRANGRAGSKQ